MNDKKQFPSREELDEAFHFLHDAINKITVEEEEEMLIEEIKGSEK